VLAWKRKSREKRRTWAEKNRKKTKTSIEQNSLYRWLFLAPSVVNQRGNRGISDSSVSPPIKIMRQFTHREWQCCIFRTLPRLPSCWKVSNNPQPTTTTLEYLHEVVDCQKNWANYQDERDWRLYRGFQNCEESWIRRWLSIEKPQSFCLVRSCHNINCSNVFAKVDIPLPLELVDQLLPDFKLVAPTLTNYMQPPWYNSDEMWISWWVPGPF